jgi:hypothetical protein
MAPAMASQNNIAMNAAVSTPLFVRKKMDGIISLFFLA